MNRSVFSLRIALPTALAAAFAAVLLLVPAALSDTPSVLWTTPTPKDQAKFNVTHGKRVTIKLAAASADGTGIVHIAPAKKLPAGVTFNSSDGLTASATFSWIPDTGGDYKLSFTASLVGTTTVAPTLTYRPSREGLGLSREDEAHGRQGRALGTGAEARGRPCPAEGLGAGASRSSTR